jgi:membrane protease subunit HflK
MSDITAHEEGVQEDQKRRFGALVKASFIAMGVDLLLILLKYILGKLTGCTLLTADALHSSGDLAVSFTVLMSISMNRWFRSKSWAKYAEILVSTAIAIFLIIGAFWVMSNAFSGEPSSFRLNPDMSLVIAFIGISIACAVTIVMSRFKSRIGKKHDSVAFMAEGIHSYSDFFTSLGVWFTLLLGYFGIHLERITAFIIGIVVLRIGVKLSIDVLRLSQVRKTLKDQMKKRIPEKLEKKLKRFFDITVSYFMKFKSWKRILKVSFPGMSWFFKYAKRLIWLNIFIIILLYIGLGFYMVLPYQTGVEMLFGKVTELNSPGLHFHLPEPFGRVLKIHTGVSTRLEIGFRTNWAENVEEPEAYLWELTHADGRFIKNYEESIALTGDENLVDGNFLCYYRITDPVHYGLNCGNARETLRSLFCQEVHAVLGHYPLESLLTSLRGAVQEELTQNMKKAVEKLYLGVEIITVYMQEAHPPIEVVPQYRAVASAREKKDEIIHQANAYANKLLPLSRGQGEKEIIESLAYAFEKKETAAGNTETFRLKEQMFSSFPALHKIRLWWDKIEKILKDKTIYVLPENAKRRFYTSDTPFASGKSKNLNIEESEQ